MTKDNGRTKTLISYANKLRVNLLNTILNDFPSDEEPNLSAGDAAFVIHASLAMAAATVMVNAARVAGTDADGVIQREKDLFLGALEISLHELVPDNSPIQESALKSLERLGFKSERLAVEELNNYIAANSNKKKQQGPWSQ